MFGFYYLYIYIFYMVCVNIVGIFNCYFSISSVEVVYVFVVEAIFVVDKDFLQGLVFFFVYWLGYFLIFFGSLVLLVFFSMCQSGVVYLLFFFVGLVVCFQVLMVVGAFIVDNLLEFVLVDGLKVVVISFFVVF